MIQEEEKRERDVRDGVHMLRSVLSRSPGRLWIFPRDMEVRDRRHAIIAHGASRPRQLLGWVSAVHIPVRAVVPVQHWLRSGGPVQIADHRSFRIVGEGRAGRAGVPGRCLRYASRNRRSPPYKTSRTRRSIRHRSSSWGRRVAGILTVIAIGLVRYPWYFIGSPSSRGTVPRVQPLDAIDIIALSPVDAGGGGGGGRVVLGRPMCACEAVVWFPGALVLLPESTSG